MLTLHDKVESISAVLLYLSVTFTSAPAWGLNGLGGGLPGPGGGCLPKIKGVGVCLDWGVCLKFPRGVSAWSVIRGVHMLWYFWGVCLPHFLQRGVKSAWSLGGSY